MPAALFVKHAPPAQQEPRSKGGRLAEGFGLALATILALLYAVAWHAVSQRHGSGLRDADAGLDITRAVWLSLSDGAPGRVLDVLLSTVLPLLILGSMLVSQTFLGSAMGTPAGETSPVRRLVAALHAVVRFLLPTLALGSLFMMERPGIDIVTIAAAWCLPVCACLIWFWLNPIVESGVTEPATSRDALLISGTLLTLVLAFVAGLSLQLSATIALGMVIAKSLFDTAIRQQPNIILHALARSSIAFGRFLIVGVAVGLILMVLDRTGLPIDVARFLAGAAGEAKLPLLVLATIAAIGMGLIMPGFAAYLITAALIVPALRTVGIASPTAHTLILAVSAMTVAVGCGVKAKTA